MWLPCGSLESHEVQLQRIAELWLIAATALVLIWIQMDPDGSRLRSTSHRLAATAVEDCICCCRDRKGLGAGQKRCKQLVKRLLLVMRWWKVASCNVRVGWNSRHNDLAVWLSENVVWCRVVLVGSHSNRMELERYHCSRNKHTHGSITWHSIREAIFRSQPLRRA